MLQLLGQNLVPNLFQNWTFCNSENYTNLSLDTVIPDTSLIGISEEEACAIFWLLQVEIPPWQRVEGNGNMWVKVMLVGIQSV